MELREAIVAVAVVQEIHLETTRVVLVLVLEVLELVQAVSQTSLSQKCK